MCLWNSVLDAVHWQGLSVGCKSDYHKLRIWERKEWMVCHSDRKYLHHRLLPAITIFLSLSDEDSNHFTKKNWMYHFDKFNSIRNFVCYQYCFVPPVLCCIFLYFNTSILLGRWNVLKFVYQ